MTLASFTTLIQDKFFVELTTPDAVSSFTKLNDETSAQIREVANSAGVLVFLKTINKIWAKGVYYGISEADVTTITSKITTLENAIQSIGTPLSGLAALAQQNSTDITNLQTLIGASELAEGANNILARITSIETELSAMSGGTSLSQAVNDLVDARLSSVLDGQIQDYLDENDYITSDYLDENDYITDSDLTSIRTALSNAQSDIAQKAAQSDFSNLVALIGAGSLTDQNWTHNPKTIITVINEINNTTQTLTEDVSELSTAISGIPKFDIVVVNSIPTISDPTQIPSITVNGVTSPVGLTTIYLVPSPQDEQDPIPSGETTSQEMYTEYICININAGRVDENSQPLAPSYKWEKLGRQAFKMTNYFDKTEINSIKEDLEDSIADLVEQIGAAGSSSIASQIAALDTRLTALDDPTTGTVTTLSNTISALQTSMNLLIDSNGVLQFTGEDIKTTSDANSNTIAVDIASLQSNKLDKTTLSWVVVNETIQSGE